MRPGSLLPALLCCLATAASARQEGIALGRLFHTPQQRANLDGLRERNLRLDTAGQSGTIRLDGIVLRSDGRNTVWLNRQAINDRADTFHADPQSLSLPTGTGTQLRLRVGESLQPRPVESAQ